MSDITEIIDRLESALPIAARFNTGIPASVAEISAILTAYRQQAAELAELREKLRKLEDQEPVKTATYYAAVCGKHIQRDTRNEQLEIYEEARFVPNYRGTSVLEVQVSAHKGPLFARPKPAPVGVPEWQPIETAPKEKMVLIAAEFGCGGDWRLKVGYFNVEDGSWKVFGASWEPTHWMPLPAAPQPKENSHD